MKITSLAAFSLVCVLAGCTPDRTSATSGIRAQRMAVAVWSGVWTSPHPETANSWHAAFLPDGTMTISGPGLRGHGIYRATADTIVAQIRGSNQTLRFVMDSTGHELVFDTGLEEDRGVPVRLIRAE